MTCKQSDADVENRTIEETTFVDDEISINEKWNYAPDGGWKAWFAVAGGFLVNIRILAAKESRVISLKSNCTGAFCHVSKT